MNPVKGSHPRRGGTHYLKCTGMLSTKGPTLSKKLLRERVYISDVLPKKCKGLHFRLYTLWKGLHFRHLTKKDLKDLHFRHFTQVKGSLFCIFYSGYSEGSSVHAEHFHMVWTEVSSPVPPGSHSQTGKYSYWMHVGSIAQQSMHTWNAPPSICTMPN